MLTKEREEFLERLQELGVVDITRSVKPIDDNSRKLFGEITKSKSTLEILDKYDFSNDVDYQQITELAKKVEIPAERVEFVNQQSAKLRELNSALAATEREIKARLPWGEYNKESIQKFEALGYKLHFYCVDKKSFDPSWINEYPLQVISTDDKKCWFVIISENGSEYKFKLSELPAPEGDYKEAKAELDRIKYDIIECKASLLKAKESANIIKDDYSEQLVELDKYLAAAATKKAAEDMITVITGFAPVDEEQRLCEEFDKMGIYYIKEDAVEEDNPPIKIKNNWFARQFEVFTGMYGMPVYSEFDPTVIVAPFYLLFFAMCLGDAGYGLVLLLFGLMLNKGWVKIGMFDGLGTIISILGAGTAVVGTILGTFFGMSLVELSWVPEWLKSCMIVGKIELFGMGEFDIQMILAVCIGIFHICIALIVKAICHTKRFGFKNSISAWGWLLLILGGVIIATLGIGKIISPEVIKWAVIVVGVISALGIYIFNTPGRNPLINIGSGLWDTYNMATGILGDVLSYIRLFALGLAGAKLGEAFNDLAGMTLGESFLTWIPFILILIFGHVLNILMSSLGAFVHPLRLTFVEYFKNAGYEGKGNKYNPLTKNKIE